MKGKASFVGSIRHTPDTIELLYKTEYYTYDTLHMLIRVLTGVILAVVGLTVEMSRVLQVILLLAGCWLVSSKDFPASVRADKALDNRKAALPMHICSFFEDRVELSGEGTVNLKYEQFQRLIEDDGYLYLFLGRKSVCMIEKAGIEGGSPEELKEFVIQHTGLSWRRNRSLLTMNLADLRQAIQDRWAR